VLICVLYLNLSVNQGELSNFYFLISNFSLPGVASLNSPVTTFAPPLAFFVYAHNLAETTRAIEVAKALREQKVEIHFFTHGGPHEERITEACFSLTTLSPYLTAEKHAYLTDLDQARRIGQPFTTAELMAYVAAELKALRSLQPMAVYAGMNLPCAISARAAGIPLIYLLPTAGTLPYFHHKLATYPETLENRLTRRLPQSWKDKLFNWAVPRLPISVGNFNQVARHFGVSPFATILDVLKGDLNLMADLSELTGLPAAALPPGYHYIGPLFAHLPLPVPAEVLRLFHRPGLKVFCAMGSSAPVSLLRQAVSALAETGYNTVVATTSIIDPAELNPLPENIFATRYLPAPQVNELADIAVIHGGQGTVQTALWAGTPIIGVALQFEQQSNLEMIVRSGAGLRLPLRDFSRAKLLAGIDQVTRQPSYRQNAQRLKQLIRSVNGATNAARIILSFLEQYRSRHEPTTHHQ
jgi:UDP:flavonoid glycosyltransferase YjiC (YdhE family)